MKLHLPKLLRNAVLACITAVAGISTTVGTAAITGGVVTFAMSQQQAAAATPTIADGVATFAGASNTNIQAADIGEAKKIIFNMEDSGADNWFGSGNKFAADVDVQIGDGSEGQGGLYINNGNQNYHAVFRGALSGTGTISKKGNGTGNTIQFHGDTTAYNGNVELQSAENFTLIIGGAHEGTTATAGTTSATSGVFGSGSITSAAAANRTSTVKIAHAASATPVYVTNAYTANGAGSDYLIVEGGADYIFTKDCVAENFSLNAGSATFQSALTLNGTVALRSAITAQGAVTLGENVVFDLTNLTATDGVYQLFSNNVNLSTQGLDVSNITGVLTAGKEWTFNSNGSLSYVVVANSLTYSGGTLSLGVGSTLDGGATFADHDIVTFQTADANVTLAGSITSSLMTVNEGVTVTLTGGEYTMSGTLDLKGTIVLKDQKFAGMQLVDASTGTIVTDWGTQHGNSGWIPAGFDGDLVVRGGRMESQGAKTYDSVVVEDGGQLMIRDRVTSNMTISGRGYAAQSDKASALKLAGGSQGDNQDNAGTMGGQVSGNVTAVGDVGLSVWGSELGAINGSFTADSDVYYNEHGNDTGTLRLKGNVSVDGTMHVMHGTIWLGDNQSSNHVYSIGTLKMYNGTRLVIHSNATDSSSTNIEMNGATLRVWDMGSTNDYLKLGKLSLTGENTFSWKWNGGLNFTSLTGEGSLKLQGAGAGNPEWLHLGSVKDFNGTIVRDTAVGTEIDSLTIGTVDVGAGLTTTISTEFTAKDFSKRGEGTLSLGAVVTVEGDLNVNYEGSLTLADGASIVLGSNLGLLHYTGDNAKVMNLGSLATNVAIDIMGVDASKLASGIDLGFAVAEDGLDALKGYLDVVGFADSDITLTRGDNGNAWLSTSATPTTDWDINWGAAGLKGAPTVLEPVAVAESLALAGNEAYDKEGYVAINATGGGENVIIYGGKVPGEGGSGMSSSESVWIKASAGKFLGLIGASRAQNWMGGSGWNLNADTHIAVEGAETEVGHIIGGYIQECHSPVFNGNSYISVKDGKVTGNIVGSSATVDGDNYTSYHNGSTNVFIYVPLSDATTATSLAHATEDPTHVVVGGGISLVHSGNSGRVARYQMTGETNVTIDLSAYSGSETTFAKAVYGGNYTNRTNVACVSKIIGDTNVTIKGGNISFNKDIVGGSLMRSGDAEISGTASLNIASGTFTGNVVAGSYSAEGVAAGDTSYVGKTDLKISGGTFTAGNKSVIGGSFLHSGAGAVEVGSANSTIAGGTITNLVGGHLIGGDGTTAANGTLGGATVTVSAGTVTNLIGGSRVWRNHADSTVEQGDIVIELQGGTVSGSLYAAGSQKGSTKISTASTTVKIHDSASINGTVSGGYEFASGKSGSTVTGDSTLQFIGDNSNRHELLFKDFTVIDVANTATLGALQSAGFTKKGTGNLTINSHANNNIASATVAAGSLTLNGSYSIAGGVEVQNGGTLVTGGATTLGGALTLADGAALNVKAGALTLAGDAGAALTLNGKVALTMGSLSGQSVTLLAGVASGVSATEVAADTIFSSITSNTEALDLSDFTVKLDGTNLVLVDNRVQIKELIWDAANSTWKVGSKFGSTDADTFASGDKATFGALTEATEEVTIDGAVAAASVSIAAGADKVYSFVSANSGQLTTSTLEIGAGTAKFGTGTLNIGALETLTVDGVLDISALHNSGDAVDVMNMVASATGTGTVVLGDSWWARKGEELTYNVNIEATDALEFNSYGGSLVLNIAKNLTITADDDAADNKAGDLLLDNAVTMKVLSGASVVAGGTIRLGHEEGGSMASHVELQDGASIKAASITKTAATGSTFTMTGGTLELTGTAGIAEGIAATISGGTLKAGANGWGITGTVTDGAVSGATIGGVTIETGEGTITLTNATITSQLSNANGKVALAGTINVDTTNYTPAATSVTGYSEGENGYQRTDSVYSLVNTVGNLTVSDVTWQVNGSTEGVSYADGGVILAGTYGTEYYLRTADGTYGALTGDAHAQMTAVVLDGANLSLDQALNNGVLIKAAKEGQSVVTIGSGVTLASASTVADASHQIKLGGGGTYALADGVSTLGDGVVLGDWTGTVKVTNVSQSDGKMNISTKLNPLANAHSSVTVTNVKGYFDTATANALTANLVLVNAADGTSAISITNGNADSSPGARKAVISGSVSGDGDIAFSTWSGINSKYATYEFTGEISGWTGSFVNKGIEQYSGYANVIIAGDTEINASVVNDADRYTGSKLYLTIGGESDVVMNGAVNVDMLTVNQNTSFTNTVAATDMVIAAAASVTNDLSLTTLNNTGSLTATDKSITVTGAVTGTGSISAGALTLQAATNTVGALTLSGDLTLGTAEATSSLTATSLTMGATDSSVVLNKLGTNLLTVGTLGSALDVSITDALLEAMIQDGTSSLELMTLTDIGSYELSLNGETAGYGVADGQYLLKLDRDATTGVVTLVVASQGSVWGGTGDDADNLWSSATNWNGGVVPAEDESVVFDGRGSSTVVVDGEIMVENLTFATNTDTTEVPEPVTEYTLEAGEGDSLLLVNSNLAVNNGSTVNVATEVAIANHTRIANGATLTVNEGGTLRSQNGIENNGTINNNYDVIIGSGVSVGSATADTLTNNGTFNNNAEGVLTVGEDIINSGTLNNAGELSAAGLVENSGSIAVTGGTVTIGVTGTADDVISLDNDSSIAVSGGVVTINGSVDNDGTITIGGDLADDGETPLASVTVNGNLDNTNGTITISGGLADDGETPLASVTVNGDLDNTNGTITIGSAAVADIPDTEDVETAAATYGSLTVTGNLTGTGATDKLTVEEGSSLAVGGDLTALEDVELAFGGDITVGGNVDISTLTNNGTFKTTSTADDASVEIGTLKGSGELNVAGGTLYIGSQVDFTGSLTGNGKLVAGAADGEAHDFTLLTKQDAVTDADMATDIAADSLTVSGRWMKDGEVVDADTEGAVWDSANGSILGDVATNSIVIDVLNAAVSPHLTLNSLTGKLDDADTDTTVEITLAELGSSEGVQDLIAAGEKTYHLLHIAGSTTDLKLTDNLSDADEQLLWKSGLRLSELQSTSPMALRAAGKDVSISVLEQTLKEATWDTAGDTTKIGLDLGTLTNGTMVLHSNDMLDNVKSVNVTADTELDLSGSDDAAVNINGLTGEKNLTISGNGDTVNVTTAVEQDDDTTLDGKYDGALALKGVNASVSGQYGSSDSALGSGTLEKKGVLVGEDATAKLDVKDSLVVLDGGSLSGDSKMDAGALAVRSTNADIVEGNIMVDTGNKLTIENGTLIAIVGEATDSLVLDVQGTGKHVIADLGTVDGAAGDVAIVDAQNKSIAVMDKYFSGVCLENGKVVADRNTSYYSDKADESLSANGAAGMQLADAAMVALNPQATAPQGDLAGVLNMLDTATGAAADELGASLAGASTAVLGMATMGDVDRQLQAIRNRTTTMGVDQSVVNAEMPYFNAWINAEGDRSELSESGTESGYELSSWGGTVGFDVDLCPTFTAGMALTAMYGDIDTTGADKASGNIDTYYVTAFARYAPSAWTHTFVATVGMSDISLDRHVAGAEVEGETDGLSFGLMYEVGRVFALTEDGSTCLQPVFNVTWKHTAIDAYTEDGSDLALEVDEQTLDTVTFGLGARLQTVVGESMYNRTSILEARVLAKADVGDRSGSADVALSALPGAKASVDSAEMGAFGLEAGAGLTIPVGDEGGSIFMDASVELRSDYTNVNGTVGYRINF